MGEGEGEWKRENGGYGARDVGGNVGEGYGMERDMERRTREGMREYERRV